MAGHSRPKDGVAFARLCPAIHIFACCHAVKSWMPGTRPGMTEPNFPELSMTRLFAVVLFSALSILPFTQTNAAEREPYGIGLEGFAYPYPVNMLPLVNN